MPAPQRLGKYRILRKLGAGAMGIVYEGFDPLIERSVALKVIRQDGLGNAEASELRARLRREAQAAGRLAHPGIVAVYEYGEDDSGQGAFIAMEMVRGRELKTVLDEGRRFSAAEAVRVMRAVLAALQHAHERGVVHRDIKPSNVFLQDDGEIKVADFGVARIESSDLTQTGAMIGTPSYMSPEQLLGQPVDGRSDLFSCGVVLYQLLTGEKPFTGSVTTVMHKLLHEPAAPPSTLDTSLIPRWDAVMERALAKQPAARYQSAAEFSRAIVQALDEMPGHDDSTVIMPAPRATAPTPPKGPAEEARRSPAAPPPTSAPRTAATSASTAPSARKPTTVIATAVAAVLATTAGAWWLLRDGSSSPAPLAQAPTPTASAPASPVAAATADPAPAAIPAVPPAPPPAVAAPAPAPSTIATPRAQAPAASIAAPRTPTPAASVMAPRAPAPPAAATAPPPSAKPPDPWQAARSRLDAASLLSPGHAMRLLLDVRSADERELLADFDRMLAAATPHSAVAFGVRDGQLRWRTQSKAADAGTASRLALQRCNEGLATPCRVVLRDGEFSGSAFVEATAALGEVDVPTVRSVALRSVATNVKAWREQQAAAASAAAAAQPLPAATAPRPAAPTAPAYGAAPAPQAATTAAPGTQGPAAVASQKPMAETANPNNEWTRAQSALRASPGPASLADSLIVLLGAQSDSDIDTLRRFGSAMKRLRWISALAMGESRSGLIAYGYASGSSKESWAQEGALEACARSTSVPCTVVFLNGDVRNAELAALAGKLSSRSQATVRRAFVESAKQTLARGSGF